MVRKALLNFPVLLLTMLCIQNESFALTSAEIFKTHANSVVTIYIQKRDETSGLGSGFFVEKNGMVLTNSHVIEGASNIMVRLYDGRALPVLNIVAQDPEADLALLQIPASDIAPLKVAQKLPNIGDRVVVIGAPLGYSHTLTDGALSAIGRDIGDAKGKMIQISAPISPGSSGSPIFNASGEVIGVATLTDVRGQNLNFAPSISSIRDFLRQRPMLSERDYNIKKRAGSNKQYRTAYSGENIYMAGDYTKTKYLRLYTPIKSTLPGAMGIHFWFEITRACDLTYIYTYQGHEFYAAPQDSIRSSFSGLSVIARGDNIGVFLNPDTGGLGWFVDNSNYNRTQTIWTRPLKEKELMYVSVENDISYRRGGNACVVEFKGVKEGDAVFNVLHVVNGQETKESGSFLVNIGTEIPGEFDFAGGVLDIDRIEGNVLHYDWIREPSY